MISVNALLADTATEYGTKKQEHWRMPGPGLLQVCYLYKNAEEYADLAD